MKAKLNAAELLVKCLQTEGVRYIFGVPGEENLLFLEAVRKSNITFIVTRNEQAAVFMAATVGRLTGRVGVALSTLGPGATNLVTGVAYAELGGMPVLVITGQKAVRKSKQGKFQVVAVVRMMEPITKFSKTIDSGERVPTLVREAVRIAESERPGAAHLELPEDVAAEIVSAEPILPVKVRRPAPDQKAIDQAVALIEKAKRPIVVIASGANRKRVSKQLREFLLKTKIPFVTTQMGKGVENENSTAFIGTAALSGGDFVHRALECADTVIMIGHDTTEKPPTILTPARHAVVHINFSQADIDSVYIPTLEVVGDIAHTLWALTEKIKPSRHWDFSKMYAIRDALRKSIAGKAGGKSFPVSPERLAADLRAALPADGILSLDNGMYKIFLSRNYPAYEPNSVLLDNALATMGAGLSVGIATKMLQPEKKVLVVSGDGGIMMNIGELETAKRLGIDLVVLILNDSGFGMIRWKQKEMDLPDFSLGFGNPDFVALAESFGAKGYRITKTAELLPTLKKALGSKGIHVIDCPIDYSGVNEALGKGLQKEISGL